MVSDKTNTPGIGMVHDSGIQSNKRLSFSRRFSVQKYRGLTGFVDDERRTTGDNKGKRLEARGEIGREQGAGRRE